MQNSIHPAKLIGSFREMLSEETSNSDTRTELQNCHSLDISASSDMSIPIVDIPEREAIEFLSMLEWLKNRIELTKLFYFHNDDQDFGKTAENLTFILRNSVVSPEKLPIPNHVPSSVIATISEDSYNIKTKNGINILVYTESCKTHYRRILERMKNLYKAVINIPDADRVIHTIEHYFARSPEGHIDEKFSGAGILSHENHIYLNHPEFIFDYYIYHTYTYGTSSEQGTNYVSSKINSYNNIEKNYSYALNILQIFEYLCYKMKNYSEEMEYDLRHPACNE